MLWSTRAMSSDVGASPKPDFATSVPGAADEWLPLCVARRVGPVGSVRSGRRLAKPGIEDFANRRLDLVGGLAKTAAGSIDRVSEVQIRLEQLLQMARVLTNPGPEVIRSEVPHERLAGGTSRSQEQRHRPSRSLRFDAMQVDDMAAFHGQDYISLSQYSRSHLHRSVLADVEASLSAHSHGIDGRGVIAAKEACRCRCPRNRPSGQLESGDRFGDR